MPFKKGEPRPANAGRKPGTKNKSTELKDSIKIDPGKKLEEYLNDDKISSALKIKILLEMLKYYYTQPKEPLELNFTDSLEIKVVRKED